MNVNITNITYTPKSTFIRVFNYMYLLIFMIGILTNLIAFIVFSRKKFKNTVFSTYFRVLLVYLTLLNKLMFFEFDISLRDINNPLCRITLIMAYSIPSIFAYLTTSSIV
jgi:hypothetical protein